MMVTFQNMIVTPAAEVQSEYVKTEKFASSAMPGSSLDPMRAHTHSVQEFRHRASSAIARDIV